MKRVKMPTRIQNEFNLFASFQIIIIIYLFIVLTMCPYGSVFVTNLHQFHNYHLFKFLSGSHPTPTFSPCFSKNL